MPKQPTDPQASALSPQVSNQASIQLNNREVVLTYDKHARFRYGQHGGNLNGLAIPGQDYFQSILLVWAALSEADRKAFPDPALLVDYIDVESDEIFEAVQHAIIEAGWLKLAEVAESAVTES